MKTSLFYIFVLSILPQLSFGMDGRDESPMRVDTPRASTSDVSYGEEVGSSSSGRVSPTPPSSPEIEMGEAGPVPPLSLASIIEKLTKDLEVADQKIDFNRIYSLYEEFLTIEQEDSFWAEEAHRLGAIKWGRSWKDAVGGHIFLNTAINTPHMSLIATALQALAETTSGNWEEVYEGCRQKVAEIIKTHPYFRRRTGLYAFGATYRFNHPIGRLLFVEGMDQLETNEDKSKLVEARNLLLLNLKLLKGFQDNLRSFLDLYPHRIEDLQGEDLKNPDKLKEYADFGLPHYRILWAHSLREQIRNSNLSKDKRFEKYAELHPIYWQAGKEGDFEGYDASTNLVGLDFNTSKQLKKIAFLQGNREPFSYFHSESKEERKKLKQLLDTYKLLKNFLIPYAIKK